jgi:hypothetical protein
MRQELTDLLRAGMERVPASVPPGLARHAYQRYRKRRARTRAAAVAGMAAVAGAVVIGLAAAPGPAGPRPQTAAYVVSRVARALDAAPSNYVMFDRLAGMNIRLDSWASAGRSRFKQFTSAGQLVVDEGFTFATDTVVSVDYQKKTWFRSVLPNYGGSSLAPSPSCEFGGMMVVVFPQPRAMAAQLRAWVACGLLKIGRSSVVDGVEAVELVAASSSGTMTYWVDTSSYLPVRLTMSGSEPGSSTRQDLRWLPPTPANLSQLTVHIPAGFIQVPPPKPGN